MDIKSLSALLTGKPAASQTGDLLAQLKAAGTIEAEVIKVLQGKLLLSSRLGEILTSNTLNYKPGDQINLRLSGDEQNPVLKASPRIPRPVTLDSGQNPRLNRALPLDQPVLAVVSKVTTRRIEIRLAGQTLTLPRPAGVSKNQLLNLQRNDARRTIEITPVDRKLIYKGLLKQLVPDQPKSSSSSLVKLLGLVSKVTDTGQAKAAPTSSRQSPANTIASKLQLVETHPATAPLKPRPAAAQAEIRPATFTDKARLTSKTDAQIRLPAARAPGMSPSAAPTDNKTALPKNNRMLGALLRQVNKASVRPGRPGNPVEFISPRPGSGPLSAPNNPSIAAPKISISAFEKTSAEAANGKPTVQNSHSPANASPSMRPRQALSNPHQAFTQGSAPVGISSTQSPASETPTLLQMLLKMVPKLPDMNATQIKQWFEFAGLIRAAKVNSSTAVSTDPMQMLKQLSDKDVFSRELDLAIQPRSKPSAAAETPTTRTMPQEALLAQARDGFKLVEQALSQNLFQRASLGMQQETQQPLSLSFALPFLDQQEVRPLHIDLEQRDQAQENEDKSWDVRLSFELAELGPVACHIFLQGVAVAASFYCKKSQTRMRVEQALPELKQQLSAVGFTTGEFHSFPEKPGQPRTSKTNAYAESLIDIEV
jgi:hypothetical protein